MTIREYAKMISFDIVGNLTRNSKHEQSRDKCYIDEAGNRYRINAKSCCITTANNDIISFSNIDEESNTHITVRLNDIKLLNKGRKEKCTRF